MANNATAGCDNVCTLYEGSHHYGVAALINSLVARGFAGRIWVGSRDPVPEWTRQIPQLAKNAFQVSRGVVAHFIPTDTQLHLTNYKPTFMLSLLEQKLAKGSLFYFDPDITVTCDWSFFSRWIQYGVALCEDGTNGTMPSTHPLRLMWQAVAAASGHRNPKTLDRYFNAGFLGLRTDDVEILHLWRHFLSAAVSAGLKPRSMMVGHRSELFYASDQDTLNMAAMYSRRDLSIIGPEGMGFANGGFTMLHAVGNPKPWDRRMLREALSGTPPSSAVKSFVASLRGPIRPYSTSEQSRMEWTCKVSAAIGRFYRRS